MLIAIGGCSFLVCLVASRMLAERTLRSLSAEQKVTLLDAFSAVRMYSSLPVVVIVVAILAALYSLPAHRVVIAAGGLGVLIAYTLVLHAIVVRRLHTLEIADRDRRAFALARLIGLAGMLVFFGCALYQLWA